MEILENNGQFILFIFPRFFQTSPTITYNNQAGLRNDNSTELGLISSTQVNTY